MKDITWLALLNSGYERYAKAESKKYFTYVYAVSGGGAKILSLGKQLADMHPVVKTPVINPSKTTFSQSVTVTITSATTGATIYYTKDGTLPDSTSCMYTVPFTETTTATFTVRAVAYKLSMMRSNVSIQTYIPETQIDTSATEINIEVESMTLDGKFIIDNGTKLNGTAIVVDPNLTPPTTGSATDAFPGKSDKYTIKLYTIPENDGVPTVQLFIDARLVLDTVYSVDDAYYDLQTREIFEIKNVQINLGDQIKIEGTSESAAYARIDKIVFTSETTAFLEFKSEITVPFVGLFPNPMKKMLTFTIPHTARTIDKVTVSDSEGRVVRELSAHQGTGRLIWNGTDKNGLASTIRCVFLSCSF